MVHSRGEVASQDNEFDRSISTPSAEAWLMIAGVALLSRILARI